MNFNNEDKNLEHLNKKIMPDKKDLSGACRVQSPSSILTYKQCPRKYYYRYIEKLPTGTSIHLIRGSIVHKVLEDIYDLDLSKVSKESFLYTLRVILQERFKQEWQKNIVQLSKLDLSPEELEEFYEDSKLMITNFYHYLREKLSPLLKNMSPVEAFKKITPKREVLLESPDNLVKGYIDVIQEDEDGIVIIDYKTSKKLDITDGYKLQLAIYAMMYQEHFKIPDEVGILFLKHGRELRLPVTQELIFHAHEECMNIQLKTKSTNINDYPKKPTPLCKWKTGQCEFYDLCFKGVSSEEYRINFKR